MFYVVTLLFAAIIAAFQNKVGWMNILIKFSGVLLAAWSAVKVVAYFQLGV